MLHYLPPPLAFWPGRGPVKNQDMNSKALKTTLGADNIINPIISTEVCIQKYSSGMVIVSCRDKPKRNYCNSKLLCQY